MVAAPVAIKARRVVFNAMTTSLAFTFLGALPPILRAAGLS
jgi:hypothetical protein